MSDLVLVDRDEGLLVLTINRPAKKNALNDEMYHALADAIESAGSGSGTRAVLLRASGDAFTAGNDLAEFAAANAAGARGLQEGVKRFLRVLATVELPVVAAVRGAAVGIGLTMLLHCDVVVVAQDAYLAVPFVDLALVPEAASSLLLPRRIGHLAAFRMFALGEAIDGRTAVEWRLATLCLPAAEVDERAMALARQLCARPPSALAQTKRLMRDTDAVLACMEEEFDAFARQLATPEAREAFTAFFERRPPSFPS